MNTSLSRRRFLATSTLAALWPAHALRAAQTGVPNVSAPHPPGLSAYPVGPQLWVRWNNQLAACYRAHHSQKYPYLYPFTGPVSGLSVTAETALPWPHHRSMFFGSDRVNGVDFWSAELRGGQILSRGPKLGAVTEHSVEILDECDWQRTDGEVLMRDQRRVVITVASDKLRTVDWDINWTAVKDVEVGKTNHSLFSIRAAPDVTPSGGGTLVNAEGLSGEKATFGKASAWCDFSGARQGLGNLVEGVCLMDHPQNPWKPCPWFTRDYGFASPTPFNFLDKWALAAGKSVQLKYRVAAHAGDAAAANLAGLYEQWAKG